MSELIQVEAPGGFVVPAVSVEGPPRRIRVGGAVQPARLTFSTRPVYPPELRDAGIEGTVSIEAVIGSDGIPRALRLASSQVHPSMAAAAIDAFRQWRYAPTLLNGVAVEFSTNVTMEFRLTD
jgi:TonB family protein